MVRLVGDNQQCKIDTNQAAKCILFCMLVHGEIIIDFRSLKRKKMQEVEIRNFHGVKSQTFFRLDAKKFSFIGKIFCAFACGSTIDSTMLLAYTAITDKGKMQGAGGNRGKEIHRCLSAADIRRPCPCRYCISMACYQKGCLPPVNE
jgi:hypothetical protein